MLNDLNLFEFKILYNLNNGLIKIIRKIKLTLSKITISSFKNLNKFKYIWWF